MNSHPIYTVDYFITFFTNTRDDKWTVGRLHGENMSSCANGWCGITPENRYTESAGALNRLFIKLRVDNGNTIEEELVPNINNGYDKRYQQPTPKQRILAALYDIKKMQEQTKPEPVPEKVKEVIRYVSVPEKINKEAKELITNEN